ncbi:MAG: aminoglycoside 6-adenylyltransferase [Oscillospiraceae bacterium]
MDRYYEIKNRLMDIAQTDENLTSVITIGSSVRAYSAADEYSDIDIIISTSEPEKWLYGDMPSKLGEIMISFVEPTLGGGMERRVLYNGSLDVDLIVFTPEQLQNAVMSGAAAEVMNRGYSVMYDSMGITKLIEEYVKPDTRHITMTESEFVNRTEDFWFHTVWAAKKILRGELWTAKMCIDAYLKNHLLSIMEFDRYLCDKTDIWHNGRFLEKWAGAENVEKLESCFAHYDREDMINALKNTAAIFSKNAHSAAEKSGYTYPEKAEQYAKSLLEEYFVK